MAVAVSFILALLSTLILGVVAKFGVGLFTSEGRARAAGVFLPMGYAIQERSFAAPPTQESFALISAAVGSVLGVVILWRLNFREVDPVTAD